MVVSGLPYTTPIFWRSWLMNATAVLLRAVAAVSLRSAWLISRACSPMCASPISPSISALGTSAATESMTMRSIAPRADQLVGDLQRLLAVVGLRHQQVLDPDAQLPRVGDVQRVLGVDEGAHAARALRLRDRLQGQRGLARRLRAVDLDDAPARQPADAQRQVQPDRAGRDDGDLGDLSARSGMIAPLPNCFSMAAIAPATAFIFSFMLDMGRSPLGLRQVMG